MAAMPKTIGRVPVEDTLLGMTITTTPLSFPVAQPLLPDVVRFLTKAGTLISLIMSSGVTGVEDVKKLLAFLPRLDPEAMGFLIELLNKHSKVILSSTTVVMPHPVSGELENFELKDDKRRVMVFDERPDLFMPLCIFAGKVAFARFFPASDQRGEGTPTPEA